MQNCTDWLFDGMLDSFVFSKQYTGLSLYDSPEVLP